MRKNRLRNAARMVASLVTMFLFACCSSEEFFGIVDTETDNNEYGKLYAIACSKEFVEFQTECYLELEEMLDVDTTQMVIIDYYEGKPIYTSQKTGSIRAIIEARQKLAVQYPEFENTTMTERNEILQIALIHNRSLMKLAKKILPKALDKTKSVCYGSNAVCWTEQLSDAQLVNGNSAEWLVQGCSIFAYENSYDAICDALWKTECANKEYGGYGWSDMSAVLIDDPSATRGTMKLGFLNSYNISPAPEYDFHVHPSGNLTPSAADKEAWCSSQIPSDYHYIFSIAGDWQEYCLGGIGESIDSGYIIRN